MFKRRDDFTHRMVGSSRVAIERERNRKKRAWTPDGANLNATIEKHALWHKANHEKEYKGIGDLFRDIGKKVDTTDCANLESASLQKASLQNYQLSHAKFDFADLTSASLRGAKLNSASLNYVRAANANFEKAELRSANIMKADLSQANFERADLGGAKLDGGFLAEANLSNANLREATGFVLDDCYVRGARFSARASDAWSTVRRNYTGPMFAFHLLFLIAFLAAYGGRAAFWMGVNTAQEAFSKAQDRSIKQAARIANPTAAQAMGTITPCLAQECKAPQALWRVLLNFERDRPPEGVPYGAFFLAIALITYNVLRAGCDMESGSFAGC
jgi:uncharacterized protein YjbI with pentapeptide repeats